MNQKLSFIDVHCHLEMCGNIAACIQRAHKAGVDVIVTQGVNGVTNRGALHLAATYPVVKAALGMYPIDALAMSDREIDVELAFIESHASSFVAIGEVGMDFKEDTAQHARQEIIFSKITALAKKLDKTVIVHSRKAELACIELLEKQKAKKVIMHCFCGGMKLVDRIVHNGWFLSIPTSVKNSEHFQKVIERTPIKQLLCETDAPYLHPDKLPHNEPALVIESYKKIAQIKSISLLEAQRIIFDNYVRVLT